MTGRARRAKALEALRARLKRLERCKRAEQLPPVASDRVLVQVPRGEALALLSDGLGLARVAPRPREPLGHILQVGLDRYVVRPRAEQRVEVLGGEGVLLEDGAAHVELGGEAGRGHVTVDVQQVPSV